MKVEPGTSNAVIVAHQFNPSVVNQVWLVDNDIVARDEFQEGCVFSDMVVNVNAKDFSLFVSPEQLQFVPKDGGQPIAETLRRLEKLVEGIPHTPFSGLGLNFVWIASDIDINALSRKLFFVPDSALYNAFDTKDARFGGYMSRDFNGGRLRLDIKPVTLTVRETGVSVDRIQFSFNFHFDTAPGKAGATAISQHLKLWQAASEEVLSILQLIGGVV